MTLSLLGGLAAFLSSAVGAQVGEIHHPFSFLRWVPGFGDHGAVSSFLAEPKTGWVVITSWVIVGILLLAALVARGSLQRAMARDDAGRFIPESGLSPRNVFEILVESLWGMVEGILGPKEVANFFPLIATCFIYILTTNLLGLLPGFPPPTEDISNNAAMAIVVFVVFNYAGLSRNGMAYLKHLGGPIWWMFPFMFLLEGLGLFIRPVSLTVRLTANIFADHQVAHAFQTIGGKLLGEGVVADVIAALLPVPLYALGVFVCLIQAFVFSLLATIYIGLSTADMHHDSHDSHAHH